MNLRFLAKLVVAVWALGSPLFAQIQINFGTPLLETGVQSNGTSSLVGFTFELGTFNGFVPTTSNLGLWASNFVVVKSAAWADETAGLGREGEFSESIVLNSPTDNGLLGDAAFVWGYNSKAFTSGNEWVLINIAQTFPASIPVGPPPSLNWIIEGPTSTTVLGSIGVPTEGAQIFLQTASIIPEPATYAAGMCVAALGIAIVRRVRQRKELRHGEIASNCLK